MKEDPFMNIESNDSGAAVKKGGDVARPPFSPSPSSLNKVIKRVFHTRVEMLVYPGGKIYPGKVQGWFEDKVYDHKPKIKKKAVIKKSQLTVEESY